jgi:AraC-like DNA-binding protein
MRISPINLKILAYTLDVEGFDSRAALQRCGIESAADLQEDGEWVHLELFDRLMAAAIEETGDSAFGLVAGKSIALTRYGVLTPLVLSTPNLRQMLDDVDRFAVLALERSELILVEAGTTASLVVQPAVQHGLSGHFRTEQVATSAIQMLRFAGANNADIHHVAFPHALPAAHEQRYVATFGQHISFGQKECAITFNPALLDMKMPTHDPLAYVAARTRAESILSAARTGSDMANMVRQWLLSALPRLPTVSETAEHLGMSERSFRRSLFTLSTTHADLAQECQRLTAERLLAEGKLPLKQIAEALGFSSVHSFHRAFRRWTGSTPLTWLEAQRQGPRSS